MTQSSAFKISRALNAPRDKVWKAWTENEELKKWFGPKGVPVIKSDLNLTPGGKYVYGMQTPDGGTMWGRWIFKEIKPQEKLVFVVSFSEPTGEKITVHPMNANWPREILSTVSFAEHGSQTEVTVQWEAYNPTDIERKTFEEGYASMQQGWGGTFEKLTDYLKQ